MRDPSEVALQIASVVPFENQSLFERLVRDFSYKAPELHAECWGRLSRLCNSLLADRVMFEHDWQLEMISILTTKSKEELLACQEAARLQL